MGQASPLAFDFDAPNSAQPVHFQLSQRADHIVNDIYQWVQFNRAIINARDEPLADFRKYRRLHLLHRRLQHEPFAIALKVGTTSLMLTLLEEGNLPPDDVILQDAVHGHARRFHTRAPAAPRSRWRTAARAFRAGHPTRIPRARPDGILRGRDAETDWILESWAFTLDALGSKPELLIGGVDWISKKWLLEIFREERGTRRGRIRGCKASTSSITTSTQSAGCSSR